MMALRTILFILVFALLAQTKGVLAQSKVTASAAIWPAWQVSYGIGESSLFFFENQFRINTDSRFNDFRDSSVLSNFERIQVSVGYEYAFTDHWRGGALWRHAAEDFPVTNFYGLFVRHSGAIKSLFFNKQVLVEYVDQEEQNAAGRYRLMAEIGKRLPVKQWYLAPSLSYEAALFTDFRQADTTSEERFIDRGRVRLNLTFEVNTKLRITPYFMWQTDYYYVEVPPVYDENDMLVTNGYRTERNRITPITGMEIKYSFNRDMPTASFSY